MQDGIALPDSLPDFLISPCALAHGEAHLAHGEVFTVGGSHWHGEEGVRRVSYIGHTANTFAVCYS